MSILVILFIVAAFAVFSGVIVAAPRILLRPQLKERLWQLRDEIYDARRDCTFPYDNEAVGALILRVEAAIQVADELTPARMVSAMLLARNMDESVKERIRSLNKPDLSGLTVEQVEIFQKFNGRLVVQVSSLPLLGTWIGLLLVVVLGPFFVLAAVITIFSTRAQNKSKTILNEQRIWVEGLAYEFSQEPRVTRPRRHFVGV